EYLNKGVSEEDLKPTRINKNLKVVKSNITIYNSTFENKLDFSNSLFKKSISFTKVNCKSFANFAGANFGNKASFKYTVFGNAGANLGNKVSFKGLVFGNIAVFCGATFGDDTNFQGATFGDGTNFEIATFGNHTNFGGANFGDSVSCQLATFGDSTNFLGVTFGDKIDFLGANFGNGTLFFGATFTNNTFFSMATFKDHTNFGGATFGDNTVFTLTTFGNYTLFAPILDYIHVVPSNSPFREITTFGKYTSFEGSTFGYGTSFSGATFTDTVDFSGTKFNSVSLNGTDFKEMKVNWDSLESSLVFDGPIYVKLIQNFRNLEQFEDADAAYYKYRSESQALKPWFSFSKLGDIFMCLTCGYGVKPLNTLLAGAGVVLLYSLFYWKRNGISRSTKNNKMSNQKATFSEAFYFSMITFTTFGNNDWYPKDNFRKWTMLERLLGWLNLSLFLVTLTRVMIRP
ncbi:MAG: potassium channel family protein, partial [Methanosarcina sp.]|nr:potassium channel family protein [Methanosarcina sp.]